MSTQPPQSDSNYKDRYVVFLDILGFSDLTDKAASSPAWRRWLLETITTLRNMLPEHMEANEFKYVQFSDSIVLSALRTPEAMANILFAVDVLHSKMLERNVLLRGGIAAGHFFHDGHLMFGPALVKAYQFEKHGAPPHIGLDKSVIDDLGPSPFSVGTNYRITEDPWDGTPMLHTFINYEYYDGVPKQGSPVLFWPAYNIAKSIRDKANDKTLKPSALAKWRWMQAYWNKAVSRYNVLTPAVEGDWAAQAAHVEKQTKDWMAGVQQQGGLASLILNSISDQPKAN